MFIDVTGAAIEQANWGSSKFKKKLKGDIEAHVASVCSAKLAELSVLYEVLTTVVIHFYLLCVKYIMRY